ncbi:hypothetical protein FKR81_04335 [Lentzea tibetensis]|uniref:Uncharacterized protein n=1 Tax=Lentzea tibetensis TaxID=2591470 RepID=A0A563EZQ9_9PSEU|nr:hypothetical protein [Lentzea tibetensis]TWP53206.1 hypothetical protein FKR81_04335 [Lentzea tibetensis]
MRRRIAATTSVGCLVASLMILSPPAASAAVLGSATFLSGVTGELAFTHLPLLPDKITGVFNTGFNNPDTSLYTFEIVDPSTNAVRADLTPFIEPNYSINVPGTSGFQADFDGFTLEEVMHDYVIVKMGGAVIGAAEIKGV